MLSKQDREEIAEIIKKTLASKSQVDSSRGMSKAEADKIRKQKEQTDRLIYLTNQKLLGKDSLGQRMELERLKMLSSIPQGLKNFGSGIANFGSELSNSAKVTGNARLPKSLASAFMYSNPVTALIAENADLLKVMGGIGKTAFGGIGKLLGGSADFLYQTFRKKPQTKLKQGLNSLLPSNENEIQESGVKSLTQAKVAMITGSTNYIMTKNATFIGGKNYLFFGGGFNSASPQNLEQQKIGQTTQKLLPGPKQQEMQIAPGQFLLPGPVKNDAPMKMVKSITEMQKSVKVVETIAATIKAKQMLIVGGILLGVAGIIMLVNWLKDKFGNAFGNKWPFGNNDNIDRVTQGKLLGKSSAQTAQQEVSMLDQALSKQEKIKNFSYGHFDADNFADTFKAQNVAEKVGKKRNTKKIVFESKPDTPYRAPFDLVVKEWNLVDYQSGSINLTVVRLDTKRDDHYILHNIRKPNRVPRDEAKKGDIIGYTPENGNIFIEVLTGYSFSDKDAQEYTELVNSYVKKSEKEKEKEKQDFYNNFYTRAQQDKITNATNALKEKAYSKDTYGLSINELRNYEKTHMTQPRPLSDKVFAPGDDGKVNVTTNIENLQKIKDEERKTQQQSQSNQDNSRGSNSSDAQPVATLTYSTENTTPMKYSFDYPPDIAHCTPNPIAFV